MSDIIGKNVVIDKNAKFKKGYFIGSNVVIGERCEIKYGMRIKNSVLFQNCVVGENSYIDRFIIGGKSHIGK